MSFRVKVDLDIVKKARIVDDVSCNAWEVLDIKVLCHCIFYFFPLRS